MGCATSVQVKDIMKAVEENNAKHAKDVKDLREEIQAVSTRVDTIEAELDEGYSVSNDEEPEEPEPEEEPEKEPEPEKEEDTELYYDEPPRKFYFLNNVW